MSDAEQAPVPGRADVAVIPISVGSGYGSPIAAFLNPFNGLEEAAYVGADGRLMYLRQDPSGVWEASPFPGTPSVVPGGGVVAAWTQDGNEVLNVLFTDKEKGNLGIYSMTEGGWSGPVANATPISVNPAVYYQPDGNVVVYGYGTDEKGGHPLLMVSSPGWGRQDRAFTNLFDYDGERCAGWFMPPQAMAETGFALTATGNDLGWVGCSPLVIQKWESGPIVYSGLGMCVCAPPFLTTNFPLYSNSPALKGPVRRILAVTAPAAGSSQTNAVYYLDDAGNLMYWPQQFAEATLIAVPGNSNTAVGTRVVNQNPTFCTCVDSGGVQLLQGSGWGFGGLIPIFQPASQLWPPGAIPARAGSFPALALDQRPTTADVSYLFRADEFGSMWFFKVGPTGAWTATPVQTRGRIGVAPLRSDQPNTTAGWLLLKGDSVTGNAHFDYPALAMRDDGNLVYQDSQGTELWSSGTLGKGELAALTPDGLLVVYDADYTVMWSAYSTPPATPYVQLLVGDASVALVDASGQTLWSQPA